MAKAEEAMRAWKRRLEARYAMNDMIAVLPPHDGTRFWIGDKVENDATVRLAMSRCLRSPVSKIRDMRVAWSKSSAASTDHTKILDEMHGASANSLMWITLRVLGCVRRAGLVVLGCLASLASRVQKSSHTSP